MYYQRLKNLCVLIEFALTIALFLSAPTLLRQAIGLPVGQQRLSLAAAAGNLPELRAALHDRVDLNAPNNFGDPPLVSAASFGPPSVIQTLLHAGANINLTGLHNTTPLMRAVSSGRLDLTKILLQAGANPFLQDDQGNTARATAKRFGQTQIANLLKTYETQSRFQIHFSSRRRCLR
jgi:ankyrin repeat protein